MTLCEHCVKAGLVCPIYPRETTSCWEFVPMPGEACRAASMILAGMGASEPGSAEQDRHHALLTTVLEGMCDDG